jgi:hypothetical protein
VATRRKNALQGVQMYISPGHQESELYPKTLSWARLNFELQSILSRPSPSISADTKEKLCEIGYTGERLNSFYPKETQELFKEGEFFSCTKTGNRIVAFALKENGLNKETFTHIEETITKAYEQIKELNGESRLLEMSYTYTLEALAVFRP